MFEIIRQNALRKISLTEAELRRFESFLKPKSVKKKDFLLREGEVCRGAFFVEKGLLRSYSVDGKGEEHVIQFAIEDWWIGDIYSSITAQPSRLNIDALEDSDILVLETEPEERLFQEIPAFERYFRLLMQNRFIALQERINLDLSESAEAKYRRFMEKYPQLAQRVPQHQIARYLGLQPETLSRVRKKLTGSR